MRLSPPLLPPLLTLERGSVTMLDARARAPATPADSNLVSRAPTFSLIRGVDLLPAGGRARSVGQARKKAIEKAAARQAAFFFVVSTLLPPPTKNWRDKANIL